MFTFVGEDLLKETASPGWVPASRRSLSVICAETLELGKSLPAGSRACDPVGAPPRHLELGEQAELCLSGKTETSEVPQTNGGTYHRFHDV